MTALELKEDKHPIAAYPFQDWEMSPGRGRTHGIDRERKNREKERGDTSERAYMLPWEEMIEPGWGFLLSWQEEATQVRRIHKYYGGGLEVMWFWEGHGFMAIFSSTKNEGEFAIARERNRKRIKFPLFSLISLRVYQLCLLNKQPLDIKVAGGT